MVAGGIEVNLVPWRWLRVEMQDVMGERGMASDLKLCLESVGPLPVPWSCSLLGAWGWPDRKVDVTPEPLVRTRVTSCGDRAALSGLSQLRP